MAVLGLEHAHPLFTQHSPIVIPAKAGIQLRFAGLCERPKLDPDFRQGDE
jgi:hypothetical protein